MKTLIKMTIFGMLMSGLVVAACGNKEEPSAQKSDRLAKACNSYVRCIQGDDDGWFSLNVSGCIVMESLYEDHIKDMSWGLRQNGSGIQLLWSALTTKSECLAEANADCEKVKSCLLKEHTGQQCPEYTQYGAENVQCLDSKTIIGCVHIFEGTYDVTVDCEALGLSCVDVTVGGVRTIGCGKKASKFSDEVVVTCNDNITVIHVGNAMFRVDCTMEDEWLTCTPGTYTDVINAFDSSDNLCRKSEQTPACDLNGDQNHCKGNIGINCYGSWDDAEEDRFDCEKLGMVCTEIPDDGRTYAQCVFSKDCNPSTIDETCQNGSFEYCGLTGKASLPCE